MSWFRLYPDVILEHGKKRTTMNILGEMKTIHLNFNESNIMRDFEILDINAMKEKYGCEKIENAISNMLKYGIGNIFENKTYSEKYRPHNTLELEKFFQPLLVVNKLIFQVSNSDNYGYNKKPGIIIHEGCNSCIASSKEGLQIDHMIDKIDDNFRKLQRIGIKHVTIAGGNPLENYQITSYIIEKFKNEYNSNIEIVVPKIEITDNFTKLFSKNNVSIKISVLAHELSKKTGFDDLKKTIYFLNENMIDTKLNLIIDPVFKFDLDFIKKQVEELNIISIDYTQIIYNKKDKLFALPTNSERIEDISMDSYYHRLKYNGCRAGTIAINFDGNIYPCSFSDVKLGNLDSGLYNVFEQNLHMDMWRKNKASVKICSDCENKYACIDCSTIEELINQDDEYLKIICDYDCKTGVWSSKENIREDFEWKL